MWSRSKPLNTPRSAFWWGAHVHPMANSGTAALDLIVGKQAFRLGHEHGRAAFQRTGDLEDDRQGGHVLAAFDLAQVGTFDAGEIRQHFLGNATFRA